MVYLGFNILCHFIIYIQSNCHDCERTHPACRRVHPLPLILKARETWQRSVCCNAGGFAECFVAERTCDKKKFALKIIPKKLLEKPKARQKVLGIVTQMLS